MDSGLYVKEEARQLEVLSDALDHHRDGVVHLGVIPERRSVIRNATQYTKYDDRSMRTAYNYAAKACRG